MSYNADLKKYFFGNSEQIMEDLKNEYNEYLEILSLFEIKLGIKIIRFYRLI